ncbi:MAG: outer membrane protein assembly factor BamA [Campylobacterales bacterium]
MRLALFLFLPIALFAVTLKDIKYEGLIHISPMIANDIVDIQKGDEIDIEKVDKAILEFFRQGYFKDIYVTEEGGVLTFHFQEKPIIAKIEIDGLGSGRDYQDLKEQLKLKKGDIYDDQRLRNAKDQIIEFFDTRGYIDTVVESETDEFNEDALKLTLIVNRGENIIIEEINYCGANEYDGGDFTPYIANREREIFGWMWGFDDGELKVDQLEYDAFRIKDFYMTKGYLDAEVSSPNLKADFNTYDATINYKIKEGEVYTVSSVDIVQSEPLLDIADVLDELRVEPEDRFDIGDVRKDVERIKTDLGNMGYAFARVSPDTIKDDENRTVAITYQCDAGEKVYIRDVIISGNTRTRDNVIRRDIYLAPGDIYNSTDMEDSKDTLKRRGYFEEVTIDERRVDEHHMDLLVSVKEGKTGEFRFGAGYGSYGGISGNVAVSDKNVFGSGIKGSVSAELDQKSSLFSISIFNPRVFDSKYSFGASIYSSEYQAYDYKQKTMGLGLNVGRMLTRHLHASLGYDLSSTDLTDVKDDVSDSFLKYYHQGRYIKSALTPGLEYDSTDDYLLPRKGITATTLLEYAGVGGDAEFIKNYNTFAIFHGLKDEIDKDLILRYKARGGIEFDEGYLPINEKFYLGGIKTIRGYQSGSLSPKDDEGIRIGGKKIFSNSIEASQSLVTDGTFRFGAFYDWGMIGENSFDEIQRSSVGGMIEWVSPLGAINLIFPRALQEQAGDRTSDFEFSMGNRF